GFRGTDGLSNLITERVAPCLRRCDLSVDDKLLNDRIVCSALSEIAGTQKVGATISHRSQCGNRLCNVCRNDSCAHSGTLSTFRSHLTHFTICQCPGSKNQTFSRPDFT